jgi:hypothetical protein
MTNEKTIGMTMYKKGNAINMGCSNKIAAIPVAIKIVTAIQYCFCC